MKAQMEAVPRAEWKVPNWEDVRDLCQMEGACVSLYLGTHMGGGGTASSSDRLRALLPAIDEELIHRGVLASDRQSLLEPVREAMRDQRMIKGHAEGFAVFRSLRSLRIFRLPWPVAESWSVEGRAVIRPLWEMLIAHRPFLLLALARKNVRLLEWREGTFGTIPLPSDVPRNLQTFGGFDAPDHDLMNQSTAGPGTGAMGSVVFGTGAGRDKEFHQLHDFYKAVDRGLHSLFLELNLPVILAATEADVAVYQKINTYRKLADRAVIGSADGGLTDAELMRLARKVIATWSPEAETRALEQYARGITREKSAESLRIAVSAEAGRVLHLFVASGAAPQPANLDRITGRLLMMGEFPSANDDLVNAAMVETLRHNGNVWVLPAGRMPENTSMAALFRY